MDDQYLMLVAMILVVSWKMGGCYVHRCFVEISGYLASARGGEINNAGNHK
jgi:hypothetical protein